MNLYQQSGSSNWFAENYKWVWHLNLFSRTRVKSRIFLYLFSTPYHTHPKIVTSWFNNLLLHLKIARRVANNVGPNQIPQNVASDLGLCHLLRLVCPILSVKVEVSIALQPYRQWELGTTMSWATAHERQSPNEFSPFAAFNLPLKGAHLLLGEQREFFSWWSELGPNLLPSAQQSNTLSTGLRHLSYL